MAHNLNLARDIEAQLKRLEIPAISKKMFGGVCYLLNGNMLIGIHQDSLMMRLGKEQSSQILQEANVKIMDFTKHVMKGWAVINYDYLNDELLARYIKLCYTYVSTLPVK